MPPPVITKLAHQDGSLASWARTCKSLRSTTPVADVWTQLHDPYWAPRIKRVFSGCYGLRGRREQSRYRTLFLYQFRWRGCRPASVVLHWGSPTRVWRSMISARRCGCRGRHSIGMRGCNGWLRLRRFPVVRTKDQNPLPTVYWYTRRPAVSSS